MKRKVAIIGAGISGLTVANILKDSYDVVVFEKENAPGGLIRCKKIDGNLFHTCGGHVFNSKRHDVLEWFWARFDQEAEFVKADRNSVIDMGLEKMIPYPIENSIYLLDTNIQREIVRDWLCIANNNVAASNFEEFLRERFGETLYALYFKPYNEKIWRRDLRQVSLSWLEGKLPMPSVDDMIINNINQTKEKAFVHSTFWYERRGGSQLIADRLSENISIEYNADIQSIKKSHWGGYNVNGNQFDMVVFCGNLKELPSVLDGVDISSFHTDIDSLEYHGTTSVFCEIDANPYSWVYLPSTAHQAHRIICTGNFSPYNNVPGKTTATIEFTDEIDKDTILENLSEVPFTPRYITHQYNRYTYPIQDAKTREMIKYLKDTLSTENFYFTGRFADWEYYNMDVAIGAAMDLCRTIVKMNTDIATNS